MTDAEVARAKLDVYLAHPTWATFDAEFRDLCKRHGRNNGKNWPGHARPYYLIERAMGHERRSVNAGTSQYTPTTQDVYAEVRNVHLQQYGHAAHVTCTFNSEPYTFTRKVNTVINPFFIATLPDSTECLYTIAEIITTQAHRWPRTAKYLRPPHRTPIKCPTHKKNEHRCPPECTHRNDWNVPGVTEAVLTAVERSIGLVKLREDQRLAKRRRAA